MSLFFTSTRSSAVRKTIAEAIASGMPEDGGLYVPSEIPPLPREVMEEPGLSYAELAFLVLRPWFHDWSEQELCPLIENAYRTAEPEPNFFVPDVVPMRKVQLSPDSGKEAPYAFILELFHGRTCAFKDLALSLMGGLLSKSLEKCGVEEPVLVLAATSGDTGSAALAGLGGQSGIKIAVLYPAEGTSEIQRLQMTSVPREGRLVLGLEGNFDDAQRAVKRIFQESGDPSSAFYGLRLSSANSINIGRLLPQIVYYVKAWRDLYLRGEDLSLPRGASRGAESRLMDVVVPTGNFGDILAARYAKSMGLPIRFLVCASNTNRILSDFFQTGVYDRRRVFVKTLSPSMDILISSNLERLLYQAFGCDAGRLSEAMREFELDGVLGLSPEEREKIADFRGGWADDAATMSTIRSLYERTGILVDPHTAVAVHVAEQQYGLFGLFGDRARAERSGGVPLVIAATASPFKFPAACIDALDGRVSPMPRAGGELALVESLAKRTGASIPPHIRALSSARVNHARKVSISELAGEILDFARRA